MITAALEGVLDRVLLAETDSKRSGIRPGSDGRPPSGYGGDLFYGVYFGGCNGTGQECDEREYTICIDVTMNLAKVPDKKRGEFALQAGQLLSRASELPRYMMKDSVAMNAANTHRGVTPQGLFFENFNRYSISIPARVGGDWFGEDCGDGCPPSGLVATVTLYGLKWVELEGELPT